MRCEKRGICAGHECSATARASRSLRRFCSHLAMRGAPARAIQELAGHQDLGTTQRYMHLSPAAIDAAIRLLETGTETSLAAVEK
jgi:site-specific recombinase XerD